MYKNMINIADTEEERGRDPWHSRIRVVIDGSPQFFKTLREKIRFTRSISFEQVTWRQRPKRPSFPIEWTNISRLALIIILAYLVFMLFYAVRVSERLVPSHHDC